MTSLKELVTETDNARRIFEAMKIEAKVSDEEVGEWNDTIDVKIEEATSGIENLEEWLAQREMEAETREREDCWTNILNNWQDECATCDQVYESKRTTWRQSEENSPNFTAFSWRIQQSRSDRYRPIWEAEQLTETRNNFQMEDSHLFRKRDRVFQAQQKKLRKCVYCQEEDHKSSEYRKIALPSERKEFLVTKKLSFNCASPHKSSECKNTATCQHW